MPFFLQSCSSNGSLSNNFSFTSPVLVSPFGYMKSASRVNVCLCISVYARALVVQSHPCLSLCFAGGQEEQHANTSANYDVELLHHRDAHIEFFKSGGSLCITGLWVEVVTPNAFQCDPIIAIWGLYSAGDLHMAGTSTRENGVKETMTLKWCTPRTNSIGGTDRHEFYLFLYLSEILLLISKGKRRIWSIWNLHFTFILHKSVKQNIA